MREQSLEKPSCLLPHGVQKVAPLAFNPNRVNRAHWPTKENLEIFGFLGIFPAHAKNWPRGPQMGPGGVFPTNPDLADILGRTGFDFENFYFLDFLGPHLGPTWAQLGPSLGPAWDQAWAQAWAQLGPGLGPAWAQAWAQTLAPPDEFSDPNLTPLPTHPGIKYVARTLAATSRQNTSAPTGNPRPSISACFAKFTLSTISWACLIATKHKLKV